MSETSYEERKRAAEALRSSAENSLPVISLTWMMEAVGLDEFDGLRALFTRTADLIDPDGINANVDTDALLALADRFECGSSYYMTRAEIVEAIRKAVGVGA